MAKLRLEKEEAEEQRDAALSDKSSAHKEKEQVSSKAWVIINIHRGVRVYVRYRKELRTSV